MTKPPEKPVCIYSGKPIDPQREIYGFGDKGYWHYGCYMLPGATPGKQKPPQK